MKYAYTHANLWDGRQDAALREDVTVLTDGGTITAVLERGARTPRGYRKVDLKGKYLMPGLVNLHAHLFGTGKPSKVLGGGGAQKAIIAFAGSKAGRGQDDARADEGRVRPCARAGLPRRVPHREQQGCARCA